MLGRWGEALVAADLRKRGWAIAAVNFRCRMGELDIVAQNGRYLVFVEVKQRKLRAAAEYYLMCHPTNKLQPRFDVAEVYAPQGIHTARPEISYIENAF